ncbi:MAG: hypothetical protein BJ554DRAFT_3565 [Olpidium bornovanus]|uniref:Uncharacterized protein n=1 Tax=Olpidium bornovanus TaxID=278681 RepID=A0A8H8DFG1_9FUNG|nr:MAG: hypothetical protein BJ554DRAFT_3565 [Olpidium bornovanus]
MDGSAGCRPVNRMDGQLRQPAGSPGAGCAAASPTPAGLRLDVRFDRFRRMNGRRLRLFVSPVRRPGPDTDGDFSPAPEVRLEMGGAYFAGAPPPVRRYGTFAARRPHYWFGEIKRRRPSPVPR